MVNGPFGKPGPTIAIEFPARHQLTPFGWSRCPWSVWEAWPNNPPISSVQPTADSIKMAKRSMVRLGGLAQQSAIISSHPPPNPSRWPNGPWSVWPSLAQQAAITYFPAHHRLTQDDQTAHGPFGKPGPTICHYLPPCEINQPNLQRTFAGLGFLGRTGCSKK